MTTAADDTRTFCQRLLDALAVSIAEDGYRNTAVADVVRRARTSRRTFYEHSSDKEECFVALLAEAHAKMIRGDHRRHRSARPWMVQVRQAIEAWISSAESEPAITVSWIRDVPALGRGARTLQRDMIESFVVMIQTVCDTEEWRAAGGGPVSRQLAILLLGGLRESMAATVEEGGRIDDITEIAVGASIALLSPRS